MNESAPAQHPSNRTSIPDSVLPNSVQTILFQAILCSDGEFPQRWSRLRSTLASIELDAMSQQFLPLLQRRLIPGENDPLSQVIRARYRQTWATNQLLFQSLRSSLELLQLAGVRTLLLKGAALTTDYYRDMGARAMGDFDVLVPHTEFERAATILIAAGWTSVYSRSTYDLRFVHAVSLVDAKGNNLDLHSRVLHLAQRGCVNERFWQSLVPLAAQGLSLQNLEIRSLCPADLVLHLAIHGLRWANPPQLRWIPDIATVLAAGPIDWDRLVFMANEVSASLPVSAALGYLSENGFAHVPEHALSSLRELPVDARQRRLFQISTQNTQSTFGSFRDTLSIHWRVMTQQYGTVSLHRKLGLLPSYIAHRAKMRNLKSWTGLLGSDGIVRHIRDRLNRIYDSFMSHSK